MKKILTVLAVVLGCVAAAASYSEMVQADLAKNLVRFHVIANSDSQEDQQLKLMVRDRIIRELSPIFDQAEDIDATKEMIEQYIPFIEEIAKDEIEKNGKDYSVSASLDTYPFPTKVYGDVTLPAGNYDALRVRIGEASGENWWCVLFPPLCFVDGTRATIPDKEQEKLKNMLTEDEYNIITKANNHNEIPVEIRFKIVEIWQNSKLKVQTALDK